MVWFSASVHNSFNAISPFINFVTSVSMFVCHISACCTFSCKHCIQGVIKRHMASAISLFPVKKTLVKAQLLSVQNSPGFVLMSTLGSQEGKAQLLSPLPRCCGSEWPAKLHQIQRKRSYQRVALCTCIMYISQVSSFHYSSHADYLTCIRLSSIHFIVHIHCQLLKQMITELQSY